VEAPRRSRAKSRAAAAAANTVKHLPINGHSVSIATRGGGHEADVSSEFTGKRNSGHLSSSTAAQKSWRKSLDLLSDDPVGDDDNTDVVALIGDRGGGAVADDIDSPRTPKYFPRELSLSKGRPGGGGVQGRSAAGLPDNLIMPVLPMTVRGGSRVKSGSSSVDNLSTPYSTLSGISNYDYEDDFTSEEEEREEQAAYHSRSQCVQNIMLSQHCDRMKMTMTFYDIYKILSCAQSGMWARI
jgi:hypothetical protein